MTTPVPSGPTSDGEILVAGAGDARAMTTPVPGGPTSDGEILVAGAGDARANGVYARCGTQNDAPRWRHVDRSWLCILRDGSSWWIGDERAAREDLYWMDAAAPGAWNVCPCDDRTHRHFKGSAPAPALSWHDPRAPTPACGRPVFATEECPVCLAPPVAAARAPCGHVACALCLARARARVDRRGRRLHPVPALSRAVRTRGGDAPCDEPAAPRGAPGRRARRRAAARRRGAPTRAFEPALALHPGRGRARPGSAAAGATDAPAAVRGPPTPRAPGRARPGPLTRRHPARRRACHDGHI